MNLYTEETVDNILNQLLADLHSWEGLPFARIVDNFKKHRLPAAQKFNPFQPISTAPKDGSEILVAFDSNRMYLVKWDNEDGWIKSGSNTIVWNPKYWMNKPELPKPTKS